MVHSPPSEWAAPCHPAETPIQVHSTPMVCSCVGCTTLQQSKWMCLHLQLSHLPLQFRSITTLLLSCEEVQLSIQYLTLRLLIKHAIQQSLCSLTNFHTQHFLTLLAKVINIQELSKYHMTTQWNPAAGFRNCRTDMDSWKDTENILGESGPVKMHKN